MGSFISYPAEEDSDVQKDSETKTDDEPLDLASLPQNIFDRIMNKLEFQDYIQMEETSLFTANACNSTNFKLDIYAPSVNVNKKTVKLFMNYGFYDSRYFPHVRWHVATASAARIDTSSVSINCRASGSRIQAVSKLFEKNKTTAHSLYLTEHIIFEPKDLERLVKALKVKYIHCKQFIPRQFFDQKIFETVESIFFESCGMTDEEFLSVKLECMNVTNDFVTAKGLNRFLRQWKRGEREFNSIDIDFDSSFNTRNFQIILEGIDANPIWTPDLHTESVVRNLKIEDFYPMQTGDPQYMYAIWRSDDIGKTRILCLSNGHFAVSGYTSEAEYVLSFLTEDEYYAIENICRWCQTEICYHRRQYSTQKFKKYCPRIWSGLAFGFKAAKYCSTIARYNQILLGAPRPAQPVRKSHQLNYFYIWNPQSAFHRYLLHLELYLFHY